MTREDILNNAKTQVTGKRESDYGKPEDNFATIAALWNGYLDLENERKIASKDVAVMMILLKVARVKGKNATLDSFIDIAGYAACGGELVVEKPSCFVPFVPMPAEVNDTHLEARGVKL